MPFPCRLLSGWWYQGQNLFSVRLSCSGQSVQLIRSTETDEENRTQWKDWWTQMHPIKVPLELKAHTHWCSMKKFDYISVMLIIHSTWRIFSKRNWLTSWNSGKTDQTAFWEICSDSFLSILCCTVDPIQSSVSIQYLQFVLYVQTHTVLLS